MPGSILIMLVLLAGAATALQAPTNARLAVATGSPVNAALVSFAVGTAVLMAVALSQGQRPDGAAMRALPWWALLGGSYGALFVSVAAYGTPRLGVGLLLTLSVAGQLATALAIDATGAFGMAARPISPERAAGAALVVAGVLLVRRG